VIADIAATGINPDVKRYGWPEGLPFYD